MYVFAWHASVLSSVESLHQAPPWMRSVKSLHQAPPWMWSVESLHQAPPWMWSVESLHQAPPWMQSVESLHQAPPWMWSVESLHQAPPWMWSVMLCLFVTPRVEIWKSDILGNFLLCLEKNCTHRLSKLEFSVLSADFSERFTQLS